MKHFQKRLEELFKFKLAPGYFVKVNKFGETVNAKTGKEISQWMNKGYAQLTVYVNNRKATRGVHTLVALAFIEGYKKGLEINHKDLDRQNNYYNNLEWVTRKRNIAHANAHGRFGGKPRLNRHDVTTIRMMFRSKKFSHQEIADHFFVNRATVTYIVNNKTWKLEDLIA